MTTTKEIKNEDLVRLWNTYCDVEHRPKELFGFKTRTVLVYLIPWIPTRLQDFL